MIRKETFEVITKNCGGRDGGGCMYCQEDTACDVEMCPYLDYPKDQPVPTPEEFADKMLAIYKKDWLENEDEEDVHYHMDTAITDLLLALGYEEAVYIFDNTKKWYA